MRNLMLMRLDQGDEVARLHGGDHRFSAPLRAKARAGSPAFRDSSSLSITPARKSSLSCRMTRAFGVENVDQRQFMARADFKVVEIVGGRDLDRAGAFFRVGIAVGDNRDQPADQRQHNLFALQMGVALVVGMHRHGGVAEHGFRPRRRHHDILVGGPPRLVGDGIFEMPERALDGLRHHFDVGNRRQQLGVPVDETLVLVDQPGAKKLDEGLEHGLGRAVVHGETLARPVAGGAETFELVDDGAARFGFPRPDFFQKSLAAEIAAARLLGRGELALHHHLRRYAGMVGSRLPQHVLAAHALVAAQDVLQGIVERMAHMQRAGDIRRRNDDGVGLGAGALGPAGAKGARSLPFRCDTAFNGGGIESLFHHERRTRFFKRPSANLPA